VGRWRKFVFDCALSLCYSSDAGAQCPIRASACVRVRPIRLRFEAGISKRLSTFFSCVFTCGSTTTTVTFNEKSGGEKVHHHIKDNDILSITSAAVTIKRKLKAVPPKITLSHRCLLLATLAGKITESSSKLLSKHC
jgi:hypothetical protein